MIGASGLSDNDDGKNDGLRKQAESVRLRNNGFEGEVSRYPLPKWRDFFQSQGFFVVDDNSGLSAIRSAD